MKLKNWQNFNFMIIEAIKMVIFADGSDREETQRGL
jgi:hypothetical protein